MRPDDRVRIRHMIEAAEAAQRFIANRQRADLDTDEMLLFALVRAAEIIVAPQRGYDEPGILSYAVSSFYDQC